MLTEMTMPTKLKIFAIAATLAAGTSSAAMAQYTCPAGYALYGGVCQPVTAPVPAPGYAAPGYSNPVSGAVSGEQAGAASGYATGGPVGAIVGGAIGTATGTISGTANTLAGAPPAPVCGPGYVLSNGYCYPR
jgi:hypothetical protein